MAFFRVGLGLPDTAYEIAHAQRGWSGAVWVASRMGRPLSFAVRNGRFLERRTGSAFSFFGRGLSGPLEDVRLRSVPQSTAFWFAWSEFYPKTTVARLPPDLVPSNVR